MDVTRETLQKTIKTLVEGKEKEALDLLMQEMTEVQLQTVVYCVLDPAYHSKTNALANPVRFTTNGVLNQEKVEDVKLEKTEGTQFDELINIK